jgi:hypothetical protein
MSETVYVLGAGFNYSFTHFGGLRPPLAMNFFEVLLEQEQHFGLDRERSRLFDFGSLRVSPSELFGYIRTYWKLNREALRRTPFDLEACFTLLQLQEKSAREAGNRQVALQLNRINFTLKTLLSAYLSELQRTPFSEALAAFGKEVRGANADVLTFNYDTIAEGAIEISSGLNKSIPEGLGRDESVSFDELAYSHYNWNPPLAYGLKFDEVTLAEAGPSRTVSKEVFYSHPQNVLYRARVLKLHGSLNWFRYLPLSAFHSRGRSPSPPDENKLLVDSKGWWVRGDPPLKDGWFLDSVIITPLLYKNYEMSPFPLIWSQAREALEACRHLVVIGYSLPPTDFGVQRLFLEAFKETRPQELTVVNPNTDVARRIKELCHYQGRTTVCNDVGELYGVSTKLPETKGKPEAIQLGPATYAI